MAALDGEIRRLRIKAKQLEGQIDENFNYFQQHSGSLFVRSLLPRKLEGETLTGYRLLDRFMENEQLQKVILRLVGIAIGAILGDRLVVADFLVAGYTIARPDFQIAEDMQLLDETFIDQPPGKGSRWKIAPFVARTKAGRSVCAHSSGEKVFFK